MGRGNGGTERAGGGDFALYSLLDSGCEPNECVISSENEIQIHRYKPTTVESHAVQGAVAGPSDRLAVGCERCHGDDLVPWATGEIVAVLLRCTCGSASERALGQLMF